MNTLSIILGKLVQKIARIRGGGSALPGLFMEKINPRFLEKTLSKLPHGVVVVSGTNGKTTTTKMIVEILEGQGLRVFTNKTGSNFVRGVAAAALESVEISGKMLYDIAVLELDEAHAVHFVEKIKPRYSLLLNVMRDQLDRFGEIDYTAKLLQKIGQNTSEIVILNGADKLLSAEEFSKDFSHVVKFGFAPKLAEFFPNDDEIHGEKQEKNAEADYILEDFSDNGAEISFKNGKKIASKLKIGGIHNILNLTAAAALVMEILEREGLTFSEKNFIKTVENIQPAFGRGEKIFHPNGEIEILLVKNPAGFRSNLASANLKNAKIMMAVNDNYADGRDMSWLWDVDFSKVSSVSSLSGIRAYDIALRLFHDNVKFENSIVEPEIEVALKNFLKLKGEKKIFATYTAMLKIREELAKITEVEKIL